MRRFSSWVRSRLNFQTLEDRTTPTFLTALPESYVPNRVIVSFESPTHSAPQASFIESTDSLGFGQYAITINSSISVAEAITYFAGQPGVVGSGVDAIIQIQRTPNDPSFGSLWGLNNTGQSGGTADADIDAAEAWDIQTGTRNSIVAVIDTGVDFNHPDLMANMWRNAGEVAGDGVDNDGNGFVDDVYGYDFANNDGNPFDDEGHGTHVAGTIGAVGNNGVGVTGVNWNTRIMALKFLDASGSGSTSNAIKSINYAIQMGAHILNNSWGGSGADSNLATAINRSRTAGQIFVAAAGNDGTNNNTAAFYPANYVLSYDNVVTVASTDRNNNLSSFSNYGSTTVTLAAPGSSILSTTPNNTYSTYSGTSMATPHVSGALALLRDQNPTWTYSQLITKLKSSVDPLSSLTGKVSTGGRLNVFKMLNTGTTPPPPTSPPPATDTKGARVTSAVFSGTATTNFTRVRLTFNEAVMGSSFTTADVMSLNGPTGTAIAPTSVTVVSGTNNTQFDVNFASQTTAGTYTIVVGPSINDVAGNPMDQNGNNVNGETPGDRFTGTGTIGSTSTFAATGLPVTIPDLSTVRIPLTVGNNIRITDLNVSFAITHTYDSDLVISLQGPTGVTRTLVNRRGGAGDNFTSTVIDDEATRLISSGAAPFTGSFRPEQALTSFDGTASQGTWFLVVTDSARYDTGRVTAFSLAFQGSPILRLALGSEDLAQGEGSTESVKAKEKVTEAVSHGVYVGPGQANTHSAVNESTTRSSSNRRGHVFQSEPIIASHNSARQFIVLPPRPLATKLTNLFGGDHGVGND